MTVDDPLFVANTARTIGYVLAAVVVIGFVVYAFVNWRQARPEIGSELELAPNRKPYYDDDELETGRLTRVLLLALVSMAIVALSLPIYWLAEPGRQSGAIEEFHRISVARGGNEFEERCSGCHGLEGVGGQAAYVLTDAEGAFVAEVQWKAPALDTVMMRYSRDEVTFILNYGRANTPMPAWGALGGGALTTQQLESLVNYLESIQLSPDEVAEQRDGEIESVCAPDAVGTCTAADATYATLGETLFNLGEDSGFAGGAYSCARCHTKGWSYGMPEQSGGGFLGPNLTGGSTLRQFPSVADHVEFITTGGQQGAAYGAGGLSGAGQMPGFGSNPNAEDDDARLAPEQFMYDQAQLEAVAAYERSL